MNEYQTFVVARMIVMSVDCRDGHFLYTPYQPREYPSALRILCGGFSTRRCTVVHSFYRVK